LLELAGILGMRRSLTLHPDSRCEAVSGIDVEAARPQAGKLVLRYLVIGKICDLRLPPIAAPVRATDLWRETCFEAFLRAPTGSSYYEFNFAPSRQWATYRFDQYRDGMHDARELDETAVEVRRDTSSLELQVSLELDGLCDLPCDAAWSVGLCAVIAETNGRKSCWALKHPPGKPDFHHPDSFEFSIVSGAG
jgi:hypothetical protein